MENKEHSMEEYKERYLPNGAITRFGKGWVYDFDYSPDGTALAVASTIGIWIYDVNTGKELNLLTGHTGFLKSVDFSPDGKTLASGSDDTSIRLWDVATGECKLVLNEHKDEVYSVKFSPDGQTLASGSRDELIRYWDVDTSKLLLTVAGHVDAVTNVVYAPNGELFASCGREDCNVSLRNAQTGEFLQMLTGHTDGIIHIAFSPDSQLLASGSPDKTIVWDIQTSEQIGTYKGDVVAFSPDGFTLATGSEDGTIRTWNAKDGALHNTFNTTWEDIYILKYSPDGDRLTSSNGVEIQFWGYPDKKTCEHYIWLFPGRRFYFIFT